MKIRVNGDEKNLEINRECALLSKTLLEMGYKPNTVVVELNNLIVNSNKWHEIRLKDGDNLEIVSIVGGGQFDKVFMNKNLHILLTLRLKQLPKFNNFHFIFLVHKQSNEQEF